MNLSQFASQLTKTKEPECPVTSIGKEDAIAEAEDCFSNKLNGRQALVYKLKGMAKTIARDKYPQGAIVTGKRINRNLFAGLQPWAYPDWANEPVEPLQNTRYEVIGYLDRTYQSGRYVHGHIYLVVAEDIHEYKF